MPEAISLEKQTIPYAETGFFGGSVVDYLNDAPKLKPFYHRRPTIENFADQIAEKKKSYEHRSALIKALTGQYKEAKLPTDNLEPLAESSCFTVTTGHQVCLFTGPLYFFYKIVSIINTTRALTKAYPECRFVPVFWMATEDHDFEEANHFYLPNGKVEWESGQGGAVGRMDLVGVDDVIDDLTDKIGLGYRSGEILELFKKSYKNHGTVAAATRYLVHQLFGRYGLVCIDGDDADLKRLMIPYFKNELKEKTSYKAMVKTNKELGEEYKLQVTPREINLFYLDHQLRERIVKTSEGNYEVLNTELSFSPEEIKMEIESHPERFSPNVALRPLYQEIILPNLAYVGGGGELNYWFQLGEVFKAFKVPMPLVMLRNSVLVIDRSVTEAMNNLDLDLNQLFTQSGIDLEKKLVAEESAEELNLEDELDSLERVFLRTEEKLRKVDKILEKSARSGFVRSERILKNLEKKMLRAERKKHDILTGRLHKVREALFPREGLQERNLNFIPLYEEFGEQFIDILLENLDPFDNQFTVLRAR